MNFNPKFVFDLKTQWDKKKIIKYIFNAEI